MIEERRLGANIATLGRRALGLVLAALVVLTATFAPSTAVAQQRAILWLIEPGEGATVSQELVADLFAELLETASDAEHIVDVQGMARHITNHGLPIPGCLSGLTECRNAAAAVAEILRLDVIATVRFYGGGNRMTLTVRGVTGSASRTLEFEGAGLRETAFRVVTDFVGASAQLAITSRPTGARVVVNEEIVGETPYQSQLAVGIYHVRLELDGYETYEEIIELRPDQSRLIDRDLVRRYAELVIQSVTPEALLSIDGQEVGAPNEPYRLEPGDHTIELSAPGHTTETRQIALDAGGERVVRFDLRESPEAIRAREMQHIYDRPFFLRAGFRLAGTRSGFGEATGSISGDEYEVLCPRSVEGVCSAGIPTNSAGIEGEIGYAFTHFELSLITLSFNIAELGGSAGDGRTLTLIPQNPLTAGRDELAGRATSVSRFQLQPLGVGVRFLFNDHWSAFLKGGIGWYSEFFDVDAQDLVDASGAFSRQGWLWAADVGVRYYLNDTVFLSGSFFLGDDFSYDDVDMTKGFDVSIGVTWEDVFGIDDLFDGDDQDEADEYEDFDEDGAEPPAQLDWTGAGAW